MQIAKICLEACRVNAHMTQEQFAKEIGVSKTTIFNWEHGIGEPSLSQLRVISKLSNIPLDFIFV